MSAPASPGASSNVSASRSEATATSVSRSCAAAISGFRSRTTPPEPGYCTRKPKKSPSGRPSVVSATTTSMPSASARVRTTAMVWAKQSASTRKRSDLLFLFDRCASVIASAAAVPSSSSDAFAVGRPVRSDDDGLEVQQRLEPALGDLRLVRRVGRVPGRVLDQAADDDRRGEGAVVPLADHRGGHGVAGGELAELGQRVDLGGRLGQPERLGGPDRRRYGGIHQRVDVVVPEQLDHARDLVRARPDVPVGERADMRDLVI